MPTIIDQLIIELGLDPKDFTKGAKEVGESFDKIRDSAAETGKEVAQSAKPMSDGYKQFQGILMAVGAAMVGLAAASKGIVEHLTNQDSAVSRSANNLGMAAQDLQDWQGAAVRLGGTAEGITGSIRNLTAELQDMQLTGKSAIIPFLVQAHIDLSKFFDTATSASERLKMISDGLRGLKPEKAVALGAGMGLDEGTVNVLRNSRAALDGVLRRQREMNQLAPEDEKAAIERKNAWADLSDTMESFGRKLATAVTPALVVVSRAMRTFVDFLQQHLPIGVAALGGMTAGLTALGAIKLTALTTALGEVGGAVAGISGGVSGLLMLLSRLSVVASVGFATYGLGRLIDDKTDWFKKIGGWIYDKTSDHLDFKGGYVPGTIRGLGNMGGRDAPPPGPLPRGIRNNNPGNLEYVGQAGAVREQGSGRFAQFGSMVEGLAALANQLERYAARGNDTLAGIISKYAPPGENNTAAYLATLAKKMGVGPGDHLNLTDPAVLRQLMGGISDYENRPGMVQISQINAGIDLARRQRAIGGQAQQGEGGSVHIDRIADQITVHTVSSDARGIAQELGQSLRQRVIAAQANTGIE